MSSIDADMNKLQSLSEDLPSSIWTQLLTMMVYVLKRNWFGEDKNEADRLVEAMRKGNTKRAMDIIDSQEESQDIKDTISSMCSEVSNDEKVDHKKIESLEKWIK